jgi:hypothetical protein
MFGQPLVNKKDQNVRFSLFSVGKGSLKVKATCKKGCRHYFFYIKNDFLKERDDGANTHCVNK